MIDKKLYDYETFYFWDIETSKVPIDNAKIKFNEDGSEIFEGKNYIQVPFLSNVYSQNMYNGMKVDSQFFRTIDETIDYLSNISGEYNRIIVYAHNLDYELSFLLRQTGASALVDTTTVDSYDMFEFECILRDKHAPLSITLDILPFVTFKDSYALFNKSVKQLGKDLMALGEDLPKLEYDYKVCRLPWDKLSQLDYDYNERDNVIVARSLYHYLKDRNMKPKDIPLTFTSDTKLSRKKFIDQYYNKNITYLNIDKTNVVDHYDFYEIQVDGYQGGTTGATPRLINRCINNVYSVDIKSSYPAQMVRNRFPLYLKDETYHLINDDANDFYHDFLHLHNHKELGTKKSPSDIKGYFVRCIIENIEVKNDSYILPLSSSFCTNDLSQVNRQVINGKVRQADRIEITCNNIFLDTLNLCYNYDNIYIYEIYATEKDRYLRESEVGFLLKCFDIKENTNKEDHPLEYALAKQGINAQYGIKVQKTIKDKYLIVNGEHFKIEYKTLDDANNELGINKEQVFEKFMLLKDIENKNSIHYSKDFDIFSDGTYITEFGRYQLIEMMVELVNNGFTPIYADTDSLKIFKEHKKNTPKNERLNNSNFNLNNDNLIINDIITQVNNKIIYENKHNLRFIAYKDEFEVEEKAFNKITKLGIWEFESAYKLNGEEILHPYSFFKTLGAKKYAYVKHIPYDPENEKLLKLLTEIQDNYNYIKGDLVPIVETTIAGCSKNVNKTIMLHANKYNKSYEDALNLIFDCGTLFDSSCSGRTVAYRENRSAKDCKSFTYNNIKLNTGGGIIIEDSTYLLNISKNDSLILDMNRDEKPVRTLNKEGVLKYD